MAAVPFDRALLRHFRLTLYSRSVRTRTVGDALRKHAGHSAGPGRSCGPLRTKAPHGTRGLAAEPWPGTVRAGIPRERGSTNSVLSSLTAEEHPAQRGAHRRRRPYLSARLRFEAGRHRFEADRLALCQRSDTGMAEDKEPEFRAAVIWATTCHLKYAQYSPTNNNSKNNPRVTFSDGLMRITWCRSCRSSW